MVGVLEIIKIGIAVLLLSNIAMAQKNNNKISTGSKKGDALIKAMQEPNISKKDTKQENVLELKYIGKPICYKDAPFMWSWVFYNNKTINKQWVTIIQSKSFNVKCADSNSHANIYIVKTQKGDTVRVINVCGDAIIKTQILIEPQCAPITDFYIDVEWGEEFNLDGSKTPYVIGDFYDSTILKTHFVTIIANR